MDRIISEENFKRIQALAVPLVDSLDSVLARILDFYEQNQPAPISDQARLVRESVRLGSAAERKYDPFDPPNLTHTKLTTAIVEDKTLRSPSWNSMLDEVVLVARKRARDFETFKEMIPVNVVEGDKSDEGYHFLHEINVSVQGQSANDAWRAIASLARQVRCKVHAGFIWREKEGALKPGEGGQFLIDRSI